MSLEHMSCSLLTLVLREFYSKDVAHVTSRKYIQDDVIHRPAFCSKLEAMPERSMWQAQTCTWRLC